METYDRFMFMSNQPNPTKSATLTIEQWNLIDHALGIAANVVADKRGSDAAEKYDILSDLLTYDLKVTEEPEPAPTVWDAEAWLESVAWLESLTDEEYEKFMAECSTGD